MKVYSGTLIRLKAYSKDITSKPDPIFDAVELICKGPEVTLPEDKAIQDRNGKIRNRIRIRWWGNKYSTYRQAALVSKSLMDASPEIAMERQPNFNAILFTNRANCLFFRQNPQTDLGFK